VVALQKHASEVSDLVQEGMVALMRSMMASGGPMTPGATGGQSMMNGPMIAQMRRMTMPGGPMRHNGAGTVQCQMGRGGTA
jgi:hypothetical protein